HQSASEPPGSALPQRCRPLSPTCLDAESELPVFGAIAHHHQQLTNGETNLSLLPWFQLDSSSMANACQSEPVFSKQTRCQGNQRPRKSQTRKGRSRFSGSNDAEKS